MVSSHSHIKFLVITLKGRFTMNRSIETFMTHASYITHFESHEAMMYVNIRSPKSLRNCELSSSVEFIDLKMTHKIITWSEIKTLQNWPEHERFGIIFSL